MMNRRKFFGAMAGIAAVPVAAIAKASPTFDPVVHTQRAPLCADLTGCSLLDVAATINDLATTIPKAYRLTVGPVLYLEARNTGIAEMMRKEYQANIVVVMDRSIKDWCEWWLDACGIKIWSPGA